MHHLALAVAATAATLTLNAHELSTLHARLDHLEAGIAQALDHTGDRPTHDAASPHGVVKD